jgi:hypothetical protein
MPPVAHPFDLDYLLDLLLHFDFLDCNIDLWLSDAVMVVCGGADVLVERGGVGGDYCLRDAGRMASMTATPASVYW